MPALTLPTWLLPGSWPAGTQGQAPLPFHAGDEGRDWSAVALQLQLIQDLSEHLLPRWSGASQRPGKQLGRARGHFQPLRQGLWRKRGTIGENVRSALSKQRLLRNYL